VPQGSSIASLFHVVADLGLLEAQKVEAIVYTLWHIATYVRSWLQDSRNEVGLVEFDLGFWSALIEIGKAGYVGDFFRISSDE
jgi:hypothetical protein